MMLILPVRGLEHVLLIKNKLMTKEEILLKETVGIFDEYEGGITGIFNAMDEYAKYQSLDFAKWLNDNCIVSTGGQWRHHNRWVQVKNTNELFDLYQQEKSSLK
jgi:hypothetical protein